MLKIKTYKPKLFPDLIERIWVAENHEKAIDLMIPPNQYVNLIIPLNNSAYIYENRHIDTPRIEGISLKNTFLNYPAETKLIGIRFFAFGLFPFIPVPGKQITNNSINCLRKIGMIKEVRESFDNEQEKTVIERIYDMLNDLIDSKAYEAIKPLKLFYDQFRWTDENYSIEEFCRLQGTNYTTLNRNFTRIAGISPKKFERLIKFRKSLCSLIDSDKTLTSISVNSGYFDQAHFIREFKIFLNHTPSDYQSLIKLADKDSKIINYNFRLF